MDNSMNLTEIKKAVENSSNDMYADQETKIIGGDLGDALKNELRNDQPQLDTAQSNSSNYNTNTITSAGDIDQAKLAAQKSIESDPEIYSGPGLVVENSELEEKETVNPNFYTGINPDSQANIDAYIANMDKEIEELAEEKEKAIKEGKLKEDSDDDDEDSGMTRDEFRDKYDEAVVVIDKRGFGSVIDFTDEEREKLEKSRKIRLEEVETISLESIKTKKLRKKENLDKIIKRVTNIHTTNIVLPISGYTATMKGCSAYELISLIEGNNNALLDAQNKWSLIHSKIESTSLGDMDFNTFLLNTAAADYNIFIYGLLCSTYPDDDTIPLTCEHCKKDFDHKYSVRSLIRVEAMKDKLRDLIMYTVDSSVSEATAKAAHENAPISMLKRVKLPNSQIVAEIYVQSAYDLINKSIKDLAENKDPKYNQASILSTLIKTFFIPDPEEPGTYFEVSDANSIAKTLYTLSEVDVMIIRRLGETLMEDLSVEFGLMDITCPACKHFTPTLEMDLESVLFYRYRQVMTSAVE